MKRFFTNPLLVAFALVAAVVIGTGAPVVAKSVVQSSDALSAISKDTVVDGAAFVAGDSVVIAGTVKGDVFCAGNSVTISGTVEGDVLCGANNLTLDGTIKGDVRAGANTVVLGGTIDGSATIAASSVVTDSSYSVGRDLTIGAGSVTLRAGTLGRDLRVGAMQLTLSGAIGRHVDAAVDSLTVTDGAKIGGNLTYTSDNEGTIASESVAGTIKREQPTTTHTTLSFQASFAAFMLFLFFATLLFVVFSLFVVLVMPRTIRDITAGYVSARDFLKAAAVGIAAFFVVIPLAMIAFLSGIGVLVGVFILSAYFLALMLTGVVVAYRLGVFMVGGRTSNMFVAMSLGAITLAVLAMIPFVGFLVMVAAGTVGLGMIILGFKPQYVDSPYSGTVKTVATVKKSKTQSPKQ